LAEDLDRFLGCEPIHARPAGVLRRAWAWARKRPWFLTAAASLLTIITFCLSYGLWTKTREEGWNKLYLEAQVARLSSRSEEGMERLRQAARLRHDRRLYDEAARTLHASGKVGPRVLLLPSTTEELVRASFWPPNYIPFAASQDGRLLLLANYDLTTHFVVDRTTGGIRWRSSAHMGVPVLDPQGRLVAVPKKGDGEHEVVVQLWDLAAGKLKASVPTWGGDVALRFDREGRRLAVATFELRDKDTWVTRLVLWDVDAVKSVSDTGPLSVPPVEDMAFSPDGRSLATLAWRMGHSSEFDAAARRYWIPGRTDIGVRVWDTATGQQAAFWRTSQVPASLAFSPDGATLACLTDGSSICESDTIEVLDTSTGHITTRLSVQPPDPSPWYERDRFLREEASGMWGPIAYTPDGRFLMTVVSTRQMNETRTCGVLLWDATTGEEELRLPGLSFAVCGTGSDYSLLTLGGEWNIPLKVAAASEAEVPGDYYPINDWHLQEVRGGLHASGLDCCMHAPARDFGPHMDALQPPYPFNRLTRSIRLSGQSLLAEWLELLQAASGLLLFCGVAILDRRRFQQRRPSLRVLAIFAGTGLLGIVWGWYQLFTLLNTPERSFVEFTFAFAGIYGWAFSGSILIVHVGRAYHSTVFGLHGNEASPGG
jgi:hypothetical protein